MRKSLLATVSVALLISAPSAFAQVDTSEDDRFKPRVYGSTAVTNATYSDGARQLLGETAQTEAVPATTQDPKIVRVVEPVLTGDPAIITYSAPLQIEAGVVKAQHVKPGDVSPEDYQLLLDEAERVRAFKGYTKPVDGGVITDTSETTQPLYEIKLFEGSADVQTQSVAEIAPITTHTVVKGDTLYNMSKRYNVAIADIQSANRISDTAIALGQVIIIPLTPKPLSLNTTMTQPVLANTETIVQEPVNIKKIVYPVEIETSAIYAVLPKDTLYSISRLTCTNVADIMTTNNIDNPTTLKPGQKLTLPSGHCLTR